MPTLPRPARGVPSGALRSVTPLGRAVAVAAVVAGAAGWWLGWVELTVPALVLAGALGVAVVLTLGRSTYDVVLELAEDRVTVGERATGRLLVRNTSRRRLLPARIEVPVGRGTAAFPLPSLAGGAEHEEVFVVPTTRRALVPVGPVRSVRGDPFGLLSRRVRWTDPLTLYVHPELVPLAGAASGVLRDLEGQATRVVSDLDMSFHALRDYVAGDDRRTIHWRSSARLASLMVRQFEDTRRTHTVVALATATGDYADGAEFELAVAAAASIGVQELRDGRDLTFLAGHRLRATGPMVLLDDVSGLEPADDGPGGDALTRWILTDAPDAAVAVLLTGSRADAAALRAQTRRLGPAVRTLVLVAEVGGACEVTVHGTLAIGRIGSLADVARVLRRVVAS